MKKLHLLLLTILISFAGIVLTPVFTQDTLIILLSSFLFTVGMFIALVYLAFNYQDKIIETAHDMYHLIDEIHVYRNESYKQTRERIAAKHTFGKFNNPKSVPFSLKRLIIIETQKAKQEKKILNSRWKTSFPFPKT